MTDRGLAAETRGAYGRVARGYLSFLESRGWTAGRRCRRGWTTRPPLSTVPAGDLRLLTLEDDGRTRKITTKGMAWRAGSMWRRE